MPTTDPLPKPIFIGRPAALERLADTLLRQPVVAVDTESNSLHAYQEQVCLIQFSTPEKDYLVDPLALVDLSSLAAVFDSPKIEKVFHAAEYDLICLKRDFGFKFENLFDTMLAARILGRDAVGLGDMLGVEFGVRLDKRYQRANWGQRPLPEHLLNYAQLDTHYLIALRARLRDELQARDRLALAQEDFARLRRVNGRNNGEQGVDCWRIRGAHDLAPQKAAVLQQLCLYRDQVAQAIDRPLFKVIGDQTLLALAEACPQDLRALEAQPGMTPRMLRRHATGVLQAIQLGLHRAPLYPPASKRPDEDFLNRLEALRTWRKETARQMGVKSDVVLPRDLMISLAEEGPQGRGALARLLGEVPWRLERFGGQILDTLLQANGR